MVECHMDQAALLAQSVHIDRDRILSLDQLAVDAITHALELLSCYMNGDDINDTRAVCYSNKLIYL